MLQEHSPANQPQTATFYAIKINGVITSRSFPDRAMAFSQIQNLSESQKNIAEIVAVTADGREMLFG